MTSTDKAIQAAAQSARYRDSRGHGLQEHQINAYIPDAVKAALATGELHAADECPNREALSEQKAESRQVIGLLERQIKQMEVEADSIMAAELERHRRANLLRVATDDPENIEYFLAVRDQLVDDEVVRNTKVETVKDVVLVIGQGIDRLEERADKADAELADLKAKIENGELVPRERLERVMGDAGMEWTDDGGLWSQGKHVYRLLDKELDQ